ncbi:hypothetical protein DM02DRAFT_730542 [Periconia macrospinosa]|uniref:Uncharacterized protein n=1 Tax=Periconia macrospinosa TaxID=97972 RepID=A0A2V1DHW3_9PLEO|nr:hypothetical protein DM02DRAFT_730542 [Periconia macrospinosa]
MVVTPSLPARIASAILALSKQAWKLGSCLSKLENSSIHIRSAVKALTEDVKTLGAECDLLYAELEEAAKESKINSGRLHDIDERVWIFLQRQVGEIGFTMSELGLFIESVRSENYGFYSQPQNCQRSDEGEEQLASFKRRICRETDNFRTILLIIHTAPTQLIPSQVDGRLSKLQDMLDKLQRQSEADPQSRTTQSQADLIQVVREVIDKSTPILAAEPLGGSGAANAPMCVAEWMSVLQSMQYEEHNVNMGNDGEGDDSDDDLYTDLAEAALDTAATAFDAKEWAEADSLLQEALRVLQQLSKHQRASCDIFGLYYKLASCSYYTHDPAEAEQALLSLIKLPASSDDQQKCVQDAKHLLSQLYVRTGQLDRARSECEKTLQGRRKLLGKQSDAALESMALMAHIYILLDNRARAKSYLTMIPEASRDAVIKTVEESLGNAVEHLDFSSLQAQARTAGENPDLATRRFSTPTPRPAIENHAHRPMSEMVQTLNVLPWQSQHHIPPNETEFESLRPDIMRRLPHQVEEVSESIAGEQESTHESFPADAVSLLGGVSLSPGELREPINTLQDKKLQRREILDRIGCQPKDQIEQAVCDGDHVALISLLHRRKDFWRSKLRKRVRPERLTALHFAALFGEIDMARRLLAANFSVNEVPYGYTTALPPLKVAIGARQVEMVDFLIAHGARPSDPDTWSTLASQLLSRSWLLKTMFEDERDMAPGRILSVMNILIKHGWDVNVPYESSGATMLHQAVNFWTGSYRWDLALRTAVTSFLCENGADPFRPNDEGKTPYAISLATDHQDLLAILATKGGGVNRLADVVELYGSTCQ